MRLYLSRTEQYTVFILLIAMLGALVVLSVAYGKRSAGTREDLPFLEQSPGVSALAPTSTHAAVEAEVVVHVAGAVVKSGVYTLPAGSRINDAVTKAGGIRNDGYADALNLAAKVEDGQRIWVPTRAEWQKSQQGQGLPELVTGSTTQKAAPRKPSIQTPSASTNNDSETSSALHGGPKPVPTGKFSVNTATEDQLMQIPSVGPVTAKRIVEYRTQHGNFTDMSQLLNVSGIGPKKYEAITPFLTL